MCGIVVEYNPSPTHSGRQMLKRLRHRGPDDVGHQQVADTWLGHNRLSIVDLDGGDQPLSDGAGHWMVGNGEIYNHQALRGELGRERFRTGSDNEVVLQAIIQWGPEGVTRLRGMFAFVIADEAGGVLVARDPLGIKPLYWFRNGRRVTIASELRAFEPAVRAGVEAFPPGHWWTSEDGLVRFADIRSDAPAFNDREEARRTLRRVLETAVQRRMMADVGIGVFLSGGLDSSIVAALAVAAARNTGQRVASFATGLAGSGDIAAARRVAAYLDLEHHEYVYDAEEVVAALPAVVGALESFEPSLVRSAVPNYFLARLAAQHVKVVLTGEGADELFAGYAYLRDVPGADLARELMTSVEGLHNLNLQRCDRLTMAHGLEARVPFLDLDVIDVAQRIPVAWKLPGGQSPDQQDRAQQGPGHQGPGRQDQGKRLLREAFAGWLPDEILWRAKEQFGDGSGAGDVLRSRAPEAVTSDDVLDPALPAPRSDEELAYQKLYSRTHRGFSPAAVLGRFATA